MSYRTNCSKYSETYVGNPGPVPYCSMAGELEPRCDLCTRPIFTKRDMLNEMSDKRFAEFLESIVHTPAVIGFSSSDWLLWLNEEAEELYGE